MNSFLILHPTGLLYRFMHGLFIFFTQIKLNLAHMCLNGMDVTVYHHICYLRFVNQNKGIFLSDDHIWKCQNLNSHTSLTK